MTRCAMATGEAHRLRQAHPTTGPAPVKGQRGPGQAQAKAVPMTRCVAGPGSAMGSARPILPRVRPLSSPTGGGDLARPLPRGPGPVKPKGCRTCRHIPGA